MFRYFRVFVGLLQCVHVPHCVFIFQFQILKVEITFY